jgi:hypothetical protein
MHISFKNDEIAYLCGKESTIAFTKTLGNFFYLETQTEETVLFTETEDLMVASAFGIGDKILRGLQCTLYQLRELGAPLIVLPKGHPASPRLKVVVSIGPSTRLSCKIQPGTHPEQDVLCASGEFSNLEILGEPGGAEAKGFSLDMGKVIIKRL